MEGGVTGQDWAYAGAVAELAQLRVGPEGGSGVAAGGPEDGVPPRSSSTSSCRQCPQRTQRGWQRRGSHGGGGRVPPGDPPTRWSRRRGRPPRTYSTSGPLRPPGCGVWTPPAPCGATRSAMGGGALGESAGTAQKLSTQHARSTWAHGRRFSGSPSEDITETCGGPIRSLSRSTLPTWTPSLSECSR